MRKTSLITIPALILSVLLSACVSLQVSPVTGNKRAYGYSWEKELEIGAQADREITAQYGVYNDPQLSEYVTNLGNELLEVSHFNRESTPSRYRGTEFTFRVLNSSVVNAFALPGGYVYVTRGLLAHLDNEAQLMVVLGHEIGHVAARHASQRAAEQQFGQLAVIGGAVLGESIGLNGRNILELSGQTAQLLFLSYSRDDERESDALGVEYSAMLGYEAAEGAAFFTSLKRISEQSGNAIPSLLSSHPDPGEREQRIPEMATEWENKGYPQSLIQTDEFMAMIDGIMYGQNPREGFVRDGIFYHPDLRFQFAVPAGFNTFNQASAVILANEAQDAVIQFSIDSEHDTPSASVQAILEQEGITTTSQNSTSANGLSGYKAGATTTADDGTEFTIDIMAFNYNGNIYRFLSYTSSDQYATYESSFMQAADSFRSLNDQSILTIQPVQLELVRADRTAPFSSLLPSSLPMDIQAEEVAIINQVELNEVIQQGSWLKIPVQN